MSGLWLIPLGITFYYSPWSESFLNYLLIASPLVGGLHSFLPLLAVFASASFIERLKPRRRRVVIISSLVVAVSFLLGVLGGLYGRPEFWLLLGYGYLLWNTWHFSAQNFGMLSLYRTTQDQNQELDRKVDKYYCLAMGCLIQPIIWFCVEARWGPFIKLLPQWLPIQIISNVTLIAASLLTLAYIVWELKKQNRSFQKIAYVLSIAIQPFAGIWAYYPFHFLAYSIPHWMVEIGITGTIQTKDAKKASPIFTALVIGALLSASLLLIYFLEPPGTEDPLIFAWWDQLAHGDISRESLYVQFTIPTLISFLIIPRSFLHFYLSRQIYKSTQWTLGKLKLNP